jgi:hypothetical protein
MDVPGPAQPPEKRKVGSSTLPLTTLHTSACECSDQVRMLPASAHLVAWHLTGAYRLWLLVTARWCTRGTHGIRLAWRAVGSLHIGCCAGAR